MTSGALVVALRGPLDALRERLEQLATVREVVPADGADPGPRSVLQQADCLVIDASAADALMEARLLRGLDSTLQAVLVVPPERRGVLERAMLFTPGLGEVWLADPEELDRELLERAQDVTRRRRRFLTTRARLEEGLSSLDAHRTRRALISDAYLAALLQVLPDPVISVDDEGCVLSWNPAAERLLDNSRRQAVGEPLARMLPTADPAALERMLEAAWDGPQRGEVGFRAADGEERIAEASVIAVTAAEQRVRAVVLHDVTEQRRAQRDLEEQAAELQAQAAQMQTQAAELELLNTELQERSLELEDALATRARFYAAMSHELRTPINAIVGYNSLLLDEIFGPMPPTQADAVQRSYRAAQHLLELVNDVLDVAKIEAGRIEIQPQDARFPQLLHELLDTVRPLADQHGVELVLSGEGDRTIRTDPRRVRQILLNLLSNAIKFGEGRPVTLAWEPRPDGGVRISVTDQGRGIAVEDQDRIFDEFVQIGAPVGSGTGLGLPISRRLTRVLGGKLDLRSRPGHGSTFTLTLPATLPGD